MSKIIFFPIQKDEIPVTSDFESMLENANFPKKILEIKEDVNTKVKNIIDYILDEINKSINDKKITDDRRRFFNLVRTSLEWYESKSLTQNTINPVVLIILYFLDNNYRSFYSTVDDSCMIHLEFEDTNENNIMIFLIRQLEDIMIPSKQQVVIENFLLSIK